jgi:hypothetical protein
MGRRQPCSASYGLAGLAVWNNLVVGEKSEMAVELHWWWKSDGSCGSPVMDE